MSSFYLAVFILAKYHCPLSARSICKLTKPQTQLHVYICSKRWRHAIVAVTLSVSFYCTIVDMVKYVSGIDRWKKCGAG